MTNKLAISVWLTLFKPINISYHDGLHHKHSSDFTKSVIDFANELEYFLLHFFMKEHFY